MGKGVAIAVVVVLLVAVLLYFGIVSVGLNLPV